MTSDVWKPIDGYEGKYEVSNTGMVRILNYHRTGIKKVLSTQIDRYGYVCVCLPKEGNKRKHMTVHRLVAKAFVPNPDGKPEINHIDGNKQNNLFSNLEWVTMQENQRHAWDSGLKEKSRMASSARGKSEDVVKRLAACNEKRKKLIVAKNLKTGEEVFYQTQREAARAICGDQGNILKVLKGRVSQHKGYTFRYATADQEVSDDEEE